jgi:RNA polymerase sigma factor (sigma-70 family)
VALFRAGHDDAFRVIHDRYRQRLFAYTRQMLPRRPDAEDALQDVFVRAYSGLRATEGQVVLRAWLYRIAHNRCIDELRRPAPPPPELLEIVRPPVHDPIAAADQRESLRRLVADVRRLPEQQRSALLMRELGGMAYADMASALGVTVPAIKSLLVRARIALAQALEARDTACSEIRGQLTVAHDRGVRPSGTARRHMRDCNDCRHFHRELRGISRRFAALAPTLGPLGLVAKLLGFGGGGGAAAGGGAVAAGGAAGTGGALASASLFAGGAGHVATLIAAAVVTAGGAVEIQHSVAVTPVHHRHHLSAPAPARHAAVRSAPAPAAAAIYSPAPAVPPGAAEPAPQTTVPKAAAVQVKPAAHPGKSPAAGRAHGHPRSTPPADGSTTGGATDPRAASATTLGDGTTITPLDVGDGGGATTSSTGQSVGDPTSTGASRPPAGGTPPDGTTQPAPTTPPSTTSTSNSGSPPASTPTTGSSTATPTTVTGVVGP